MKPFGMTPMFQIINYSAATHALYDAVEDAVDEGASLDTILDEVKDCYSILHEERARQARREST